MKILACIGSNRINGNTASVLSLLQHQMQQEADRAGEMLDFETVYIGQMNIQACRGCRICFDRGEQYCPLKDDLLSLKARMKEADGIILSTPVYVNDVSGIIKSMMERLGYMCHRPEFADKCIYLLATSGSSPTNHALRTLDASMYMGFHVVGRSGFKMGARLEQAEIEKRYDEKNKQIARISGLQILGEK